MHAQNGRFDYDSEKLEELLFFHPDETEVDIDSKVFFQVYYSPGLLSSVMSGKEKPMDSIQKIYAASPPPEVSIKVTKLESMSEINVKACDTGGGVNDIYLYQNKTLISVENSRSVRFVMKEKCIQKTFQTGLISGNNSFQAAASSAKGLQGFSKLETIQHIKSDATKTKLHLFIVGIDKFKDEKLRLQFAVKDGKAIRDQVQTKSKNQFSSIEVYETYDSSKKEILDLFKNNSKKISIEDTVIFFFSGHGTTKDKSYYFLTTDFTLDNPNFEKDSLDQDEITRSIAEIDSIKKLILIDTCESGGAWVSNIENFTDEFALGLISKKTGVTVIASSMEKSFAFESAKIGHGLLAKSFLEVLELKGEVSSSSIIPFINKRIPEIANILLKKEQFPFISFRGRDFLITEN